MLRDRSFFWLSSCFFLSGLAALIYETAWTREFAFVFGTSELAVATVLAAYMGGLAAGAALAGRYGARIARPVLAYGLLELGIAIAALAVPLGIAASRWLYVALFGGQEVLPDAGGLATALFYLACSFLILLVPTAMMGATLPLLARHAVRSDREIGRRIGVLYAINTAGAVLGTIAGRVRAAAGARAARDDRRRRGRERAGVRGRVGARALRARARARARARSPPTRPRRGRARWILALISPRASSRSPTRCSGCGWSGTWSGSGAQAFATMLASFLAGIAIGAAVASRLATHPAARRARLRPRPARDRRASRSRRSRSWTGFPASPTGSQSRGHSVIWAHIAACAAHAVPGRAVHRRDVPVRGARARARQRRRGTRECARLRREHGRIDRGLDRARASSWSRVSASRAR